MSAGRIWLHVVWGTKSRAPILLPNIRPKLFQHIRESNRSKGLYIDFINGWYEHVHILMTLNVDVSVAETMRHIKGESSHWANEHKLIRPKLEWAHNYYATSVSDSLVERVRNYIRHQEEHHRTTTFAQECKELLRANAR